MPDVAVVIPAYNAGRTLARAVQSALDAGATEVVIVNDASTDNTHVIGQEFYRSNTQVVYLQNHFRSGVVYSRNRAIYTTQCELILPLDADDKLLNMQPLLAAWEWGSWVYGGWCEWNDHTLKAYEPPPAGVLHRKELGWVSMLFHKGDWLKAGMYDPVFSVGNEIWAFQTALVCAGVMPKRVPDVIFERATGGTATTRARAWRHVITALVRDKYPTLPHIRETA